MKITGASRVLEEDIQSEVDDSQIEENATIVSWWRWRPGTKPLYTFLFGGLLSLLALFLLANGIATLIAGIIDGHTQPTPVSGIVTGHTRNVLGAPELSIQFTEAGITNTVTLVVSTTAASALPDGTRLTVDYAPHLRTPLALESAGHRYTLPDNNASNTLSTLALLLSGLLLFPYPSLLFFWGWRDLRSNQVYQATATVVALRAARQTTDRRVDRNVQDNPQTVLADRHGRKGTLRPGRTPGILPTGFRTWHGVALQDEDTPASKPLIFHIKQGMYDSLHKGAKVQVLYSRQLHYLYELKHLE